MKQLQYALNHQKDIAIIDTAGRLHTKKQLMDELTKSNDLFRKSYLKHRMR